jgi:hypothetical protein
MHHVRSAFFIMLGAVLGTATGLSIARVIRDETPGPPTMSVRHERTSAIRSRCDECPQPGDLIKVSVRGSSRASRGVAVYRDGTHVKSCFNCDVLSFVADSLGRLTIVGFQMTDAGSCVLPCAGFDRDAAALQSCGAFLVTSEVVVR